MDEAVNHDQSNSFAVSSFTRMYHLPALKRCFARSMRRPLPWRASLYEQTFVEGKFDEDVCFLKLALLCYTSFTERVGRSCITCSLPSLQRKLLGCCRRYQEALELYRQAPKNWKQEPHIRDLAALFNR